jgi:hypothetical protein
MKTFLSLLTAAALCFGLDTAYVPKAAGAFAIDGVPDISIRDNAPLHDFIFPWGNDRGTKSSVWLAWNDSGFYLYAVLYDTHLVAATVSGTGIDGDDMLEVHMSPDINHIDYFYIIEFNMNLITRARIRKSQPTGKNEWGETWDVAGIQRNILKNGTPNNQGDLDSFWTVEMLVPFSKVAGWQATQHVAPSGWNPAVPPSVGSVWAFNVCRQNQNVADDPMADWSIWSHNGSFPYDTGMAGVHLHDHNNFGRLVFTGPIRVEGGLKIPRSEDRLSASPNPFNSRVRFSAWGGTTLEIYSPSGRLMETLRMSGGEAVWDARNARNGLYLARMKDGLNSQTCSLTLMR